MEKWYNTILNLTVFKVSEFFREVSRKVEDAWSKLPKLPETLPISPKVEDDDLSYELDRVNISKKPSTKEEYEILSREQAHLETVKLLGKGEIQSARLSLPEREIWAKAILDHLEKNKISFNRMHITIILVTIDRESGFNDVPIIANPEKKIEAKIAQFKKNHAVAYMAAGGSIADGKKIAMDFVKLRREENLQNGIYTTNEKGIKMGVFTQKDMDLAVDYAMSLYDEYATDLLKKFYAKKDLEQFRPKNGGCMQVSIEKAQELAGKYEGKVVSSKAMRDILNTREGGLKYGFLAMKELFEAHENEGGLSLDKMKFVLIDYKMGSFATRNAGIQANLKRLGAEDISSTGVLLEYDKTGKVKEENSPTEEAIGKFFRENGVKISPEQIRKDLLKEKSADFKDTPTYKTLVELFAKNKLEIVSTMPEGKVKTNNVKVENDKTSTVAYANSSYARYHRLMEFDPNMKEIGQSTFGEASIERMNKLKVRLDEAGTNVESLMRYLQEISAQYPVEVKSLKNHYPALAAKTQRLYITIKFLKLKYGQLDEASLRSAISDYNFLAKLTNSTIKSLQNEAMEKKEMELIEVVNGEVNLDQVTLTLEEQKQLKKAADEVYSMLFPESYTDKFVRWQTGQVGKLSTAEKLGAAPMNGIESAVRGVIGLFDPETYIEAWKGIQTMRKMSKEDFKNIVETLKFTYKSSSKADVAAPAISFLTGCLMLFGSVAKVRQMMQGLTLTPKLRGLLKLTVAGKVVSDRAMFAKTSLQMLPTTGMKLGLKTLDSTGKYGWVAALGGVVIPYLDV